MPRPTKMLRRRWTEACCDPSGTWIDPRCCKAIHKLSDMRVIAICAVLCGADGWVDVALFGEGKLKWFASFLDLPGGIPSHDTFGRVYARLEPEAFERCFVAWRSALVKCTWGKVISIDGKALRRSFQHALDKSSLGHLVSVFVGAIAWMRIAAGMVQLNCERTSLVQ
ncbi:MAG: ISAs1 family transposase [Planctomycetota bacterium]|nr:ISAs1 family transposase [Planctomycetota bacterium]